jgi:hypothetical protein
MFIFTYHSLSLCLLNFLGSACACHHMYLSCASACQHKCPYIFVGISQVLPDQYGMNQLQGTQCSRTAVDEHHSNDWLHTNMTYQRHSTDVPHIGNLAGTNGMQVTPTSYIYGPSVEMRGIPKLTWQYGLISPDFRMYTFDVTFTL